MCVCVCGHLLLAAVSPCGRQRQTETRPMRASSSSSAHTQKSVSQARPLSQTSRGRGRLVDMDTGGWMCPVALLKLQKLMAPVCGLIPANEDLLKGL